MLNIVVKPENRDRINAALDANQNGARVRLVDYDDVAAAVERAEAKFAVARKNLAGVVVNCDPYAQPFPNAYKGVPESTQFVIKCTGRGWNLVDVWRGKCHGSYIRYRTRELPQTAANAILSQFDEFI